MFLQAVACTYNLIITRFTSKSVLWPKCGAPPMKHEKATFSLKGCRKKCKVWFLDNDCKVAGPLVLWYCWPGNSS